MTPAQHGPDRRTDRALHLHPGPAQRDGRRCAARCTRTWGDRRRHRDLRRQRPVGIGTQGAGGNHRAEPRQGGRGHGHDRQAPRQCQYLGLLAGRAARHRRGRLQHRPLHGRGRLRRPGRGRTAGTRATGPGTVPPVGAGRRARHRHRHPGRGRRLCGVAAHPQQRRRQRVGAAFAVRAGDHARLLGRLPVFAPFYLVRADRRQRQRHAAR